MINSWCRTFPPGIILNQAKVEEHRSIESAKAYLEKLKTDADFTRGNNACKNAETRTAFIEQEGFDFTKEEIQSLRRELSDEELEKVAGGMDDGGGGAGCGQFPWSPGVVQVIPR